MYNIPLNSDWASLEKKKLDQNIPIDHIREAIQKRQRSISPVAQTTAAPGVRSLTPQPEQRQNAFLKTSPVASPSKRMASGKKLDIGDKGSPRESESSLYNAVDEVFTKLREKRLAAIDQNSKRMKLADEKDYDRAFGKDDNVKNEVNRVVFIQPVSEGQDFTQAQEERLRYLKNIEAKARTGRTTHDNNSEPFNTKRSTFNEYTLGERTRTGSASKTSAYQDMDLHAPYEDKPIHSPSKNSAFNNSNWEEEGAAFNRKPKSRRQQTMEERESGWVSNLAGSKRSKSPKPVQSKARIPRSGKRELGENDVATAFSNAKIKTSHLLGRNDSADIEKAYVRSLSPERIEAEEVRRSTNPYRPTMDEEDVIESYSIARGQHSKFGDIPFYRDLAPYARQAVKDKNDVNIYDASYGAAINDEESSNIDPNHLTSHDVLRIVSGKLPGPVLRRHLNYPERPISTHQHYQAPYNPIQQIHHNPSTRNHYSNNEQYVSPKRAISPQRLVNTSPKQYSPPRQTQSPSRSQYISQGVSHVRKNASRSPKQYVATHVNNNREHSPLQARAQLVGKIAQEASEEDAEELTTIIQLVKEIENLKKAKADAEILPSLPSPDRLRNEFSKRIETNLNKLLYMIADESSRNKCLKDLVNDLVSSAHRYERKVYGPYRKNDLLVYALQEYKTLKDEKLRQKVVAQEYTKKGHPVQANIPGYYEPVGKVFYPSIGQTNHTSNKRSKSRGSRTPSPMRGNKGFGGSGKKVLTSSPYKRRTDVDNGDLGWL